MTNNIRQPQLTRDTERINASDQSGYSHNLLSALEPDERAQNIVTGSSLFDLKVEVKQINSPYFQNVIEWLPNYVIALFLPNTTSSSISVWDSVGMHSRVWFIFLAHFYSWPSVSRLASLCSAVHSRSYLVQTFQKRSLNVCRSGFVLWISREISFCNFLAVCYNSLSCSF